MMRESDARDRGEAGDPLLDEAAPKDRFREALEKKRARQASAASAGGHGDSKIHGEHGAVGGKRTFRRKSG